MRYLVPFVQFKKHEKHPWMNVTFSKVAEFASNFNKSTTPPYVFFAFFNLNKWYQIAQRIATTFFQNTFLRRQIFR